MYTNEMKRRLMPTSGHKPPQLYWIENALNPLRKDYGDMTVREFGAKHLTAYVSKLVRMGKARSTINGRRHV